jgi:transposase-like protein
MKKNRQKHTAIFKAQVAIEAMQEKSTIVQIGRRYKINPNLVHKWKKEAVTRLAMVFDPSHGNAEDSVSADREAELLRKVGQLTLENDFLARGLARIR